MPRVPTAGTTQGGLDVGELASPERTQAQAQEIGQVFSRIDEAKQKHFIAEGVADLTSRVGELRINAENDPNINGATARFEESAATALDEVVEGFAGDTAATIRNRGIGLIASTRVDVFRNEQFRFNAAAATAMETLTDNYINAASIASNDVEQDQIKTNFQLAIAQSDFLTPTKKTALLDSFDSGVSSALALHLLATDPELLIETIEDPSEFPGMSPEARERALVRGLSVADSNAQAEERNAQAAIKVQQDAKLLEDLAALASDVDPEEVKTGMLLNPSAYSVEGFRVLSKKIDQELTGEDNRRVIVDLEKEITAGEVDAMSNVDAAFIGLNLTDGTRNRLTSMNETMNEPKSSPKHSAIRRVEKSLGPTEDERFSGEGEALAEARTSEARAELQLWMDAQPRTPTEIRAQTSKIIREFGGSIDVAKAVGQPYGIKVPAKDVTGADLEASRQAIRRDVHSGALSIDQGLNFQARNNRLSTVAQQNAAAREEQEAGN